MPMISSFSSLCSHSVAEAPSQQPPQLVLTTNSDQVIFEYCCDECGKRFNVETIADHSQTSLCNQCKSNFLNNNAHEDNKDPNDIVSQVDEQLALYYETLRARVEARVEEVYQLHLARHLYRLRILQDMMTELEHEAALHNLGENGGNGGGGRRGALPATESAVVALKSIKIKLEKQVLICPVCQDRVNVGESGKELPCGHCYHTNCIVTWLARRNTCPVCRFELPTSDLEQKSGET